MADIVKELNNDSIPLTPSVNYDLNRDRLTEWHQYVLGCNPYKGIGKWCSAYNTLVNTIYNHVEYISWRKFFCNLVKCIESFLKKIGDEEQIALFVGDPKKSNYLMAKHFLLYVQEKKPALNGKIYIMCAYNIYETVEHIVFIDDASYSGLQMYDYLTATARNIMYSPYVKSENVKFHVIIPYMTQIAVDRLQQRESVTIYNTVQLTTLAQYIAEKRVDVWDGISKLENTPENVKKKRNTLEFSYMLHDNFRYDNPELNYKKRYLETTKIQNSVCFIDDLLEQMDQYNITYIVPVYFQHKIPDAVSSLPTIFASGKVSNYCKAPKTIIFIENCEYVQEKRAEMEGTTATDKCAEPFYKKGGKRSSLTLRNEPNLSAALLIKDGILVQREYVKYNKKRYRVMKDKNQQRYIMAQNKKLFLTSI